MSPLGTIRWSDGDITGSGRLMADAQRPLWAGLRGDWVVLPDDQVPNAWLVISMDEEGLRRAREVITAFVGPGLGHLSGPSTTAVLETEGDTHVEVRVARLDPDDAEAVLAALERIVVVRKSVPVRSRTINRKLAHLVRDFRLAVLEQAFVRAERLLRSLHEDGRLSRQNLDFLEVEMLASQERWTELRGLPWFMQLAKAPRPGPVTDSMLDAIWRVDFGEPSASDPTEAIRRFDGLSPELLPLLDVVDVPRSTGGQYVVALRSLNQGSESRLERIKLSSGNEVRSWIERLLASGDETAKLSPAERARAMLDAGRYGDVMELMADHRSDPTVVECAVRSAFEVDSHEFASAVAGLWSGESALKLPSTPGFLKIRERVLILAAAPCASWTDWLERISGTDHWVDAAEMARRGAQFWTVDELTIGPAARQAAQCLDAALAGANAEAVDYCMDLLCEVAARVAEAPGSTLFVDAVLYALIDGSATEAVGSAFLELIQAILRAGPNSTRYADLMDVCMTSTELLEARVFIPVLLDMLDELAMHPSPDPLKRREFATVCYEALKAHAARGNLGVDDARLSSSLLDELGLQVGPLWTPPQSSEGDGGGESLDDPWALLAGKRVVIYTLFAGLGERFKEKVEALCATTNVVVVSDHGGSRELREAIRSADHVVVDTWHAKHAATVAIDLVRPKSRQVLPEGKGVSSFLRALGQELRTLDQAA